MRKGYVKISAIMAAMVFMLTGCGANYPDMTPEEAQLVGEYAAKLLLEYDANNRSRLVSREEAGIEKVEIPQEETAETPEMPQEETKPVEDTPVIEIGQETDSNSVGTLEEFFELADGIVINYQGFEITDSYPQDDEISEYFALDATEGKRLVVLKFGVENHAQSDQHIDLLSKGAIIRTTVNGSYTRNVLTTMLMDDMSTYIGDVTAAETAEVVLLAEMDKDVAENISTLMLNLKNDSKTCTIQLK